MQIIKTSEENYPEGFAKAMKPFTIKKKDKDVFILGNVNLPSALIDNNTILGDASIPKKVKEVQYCIVTKKGVSYRIGHHGQLRFTFKEPIKTETGEYHDLIISWEAWRSAGTSLKLHKGLERAFLLSTRAYIGQARWIKDHLRGYDVWKVFDLNLDDKDQFLEFVLDKGIELTSNIVHSMKTGEIYQEYKNYIGNVTSKKKIYFNIINNSCATTSLMVISQFLHDDRAKKLEKAALIKVPKWFVKSRHVKTAYDVTRVFYYLLKHNKLLPARTYKHLKNAGLLQTKYGVAVKKTYKYPNNPYHKLKKVVM